MMTTPVSYPGYKQTPGSNLLSSLRIFSDAGIPLVSRARTSQEFDNDILNGGFYSAITYYSQLKMGNDASVKFEKENEKTVIIKRSRNFIGSLEWDENLNIPIKDIENGLQELLSFLDISSHGKFDNGVQVRSLVAKFCKNSSIGKKLTDPTKNKNEKTENMWSR
jgi:hypothetical protein